MASSKDLKIINQAQKEYAIAKKKGDTLGMKAAHLKADKARGATTTTKVDARGNYYQSIVSAAPPTQKSVLPTPSQFRNAPAETKVSKEQQAKNNQTFLNELKNKQGTIAAGAAGISGGLVGAGKNYMAPETQKIISSTPSLNRAFTGGQIVGNIAQFAVPYAAASKPIGAAVAKIPAIAKLAPVGQNIAKSVATDLTVGLPLNANYALNSEGLRGKEAAKNIALNTGIDVATGGLMEAIPAITKSLRNTENKIPVLQPNGKVKLQNASSPQNTVLPKSAPPPKIISNAAEQAPDLTVQPRTQNLGMNIPKETLPSTNDNFPNTQKFIDLGADTNKFNNPRKTSKVYANTYKNSAMFNQVEKDAMVQGDYQYDPVSEKQSIAEAKQRLESDFNGEVKDLPNKAHFDGVDTDTAMGILEQYKQEARQTGDYSKVSAWSKLIQQRGTEGGQLIQAFSKYTRTPEGAVVKAQQEVAKVEREIGKKNPNLINKVDRETKQVTDAIKKAQNETAQSIGDVVEKAVRKRTQKFKQTLVKNSSAAIQDAVSGLTDKNVGELIGLYTESSSRKLSNMADALQPKKVRQVAPLQQAFDDLTKELYKIAQETLPKVAIQKKEVKATDILRSVIENKQNYQDIWSNAKYLLQNKYADNPEAMQLLGDFFDRDVIPSFSKKTIGSALDQSIKKLGIDIKDMILNNPTDKATALNNIRKYIIDETGATGPEAESLLKQIDDRYVEIVNGKNWAMLENLIKDRVKSAPPNEFIKIKQLINMGAYYSDRYAKASGSATVKAINKTAKDFEQDLGKIIKQNKGDKQKLLNDIQNYILYNTDVKGRDAEILAREISDQYDAILKVKTESALKQMFPEAYGKTIPLAKRPKSTFEKVMELINMGAYDNESIKNVIRAKNKIPVLENSDIKSILDNMELSASQTDPYMKNMYASKAEQIISNKIPATFREKFRALQRLSMILNPKSLITRNPGGNILLGGAENVKDIPGALIDKAVSFKTGQRTTAFAPIAKTKAQIQGFGQGLSEWGKDIKYRVDTSPSRGQFELPSGRVFKNGFFNALDQFERKALQFGDRPYYQAAYNGRIAELNKLGKTGEEAELDARLYALDRVFQNDSELSKRAVQIRRNLGLPGDLLMPFTQTPANILDKLIDYSPAGLAKAVYQMGTTVGKGTFDQKKFVDTLARTFTGAGIAALTYAMFKKGILSGSLSDNTDLRNAEQLQGKQYYSIKIGDKWYSYDWAQPIAGIMAATSDAVKAGADKNDIAESIAAGSTSAIDSIFNQSFLSGILTAFSGYSPAAGIGAALLGSTSQATPTAFAGIARTIDPTVRETYDPNRFKEQANKMIARIPFASKTLPAKVDVTGKTIMQNQGRGAKDRVIENFLAPYKVSQESNDPVNLELMRLQSETGDNSVVLNKTPKNFSKDGKSYIFTANEYVQYQRNAGKESYEKIKQFMNSGGYAKLTDEEKADKIKEINSDSITDARAKYFKNKGQSPLLALSNSQREKYASISSFGVAEDQFYKTYMSEKGINGIPNPVDPKKTIRLSESFNKKLAIDKANPNATPAQLKALYYAFNVSEKVW